MLVSIFFATLIFIKFHKVKAAPSDFDATNYTNGYQDEIFFENGITYEDKQHHIMLYQSIPESIRKAVQADNYKIYVTQSAGSLHNYTAGQSHSAIYVTLMNGNIYKSKEGYIEIFNNTALNMQEHGTREHALVHEIGHIIDYIYNGGYPNTQLQYNISQSQEWSALYKKYRATLANYSQMSASNMYNQMEAFAETYAIYTLQRSSLQSMCPEICDYMDLIVMYFERLNV